MAHVSEAGVRRRRRHPLPRGGTLKALVTGGAGFVGYWLSRHLADQGMDVIILDNFARAQEDDEFQELVARPNVTFRRTDITTPDAFATLDTDIDRVYHLAMINGTGNFYSRPVEVLKVGILGTINVLDWFVTLPHARLLYTSSSEAYAGACRLLGERFPLPTPETVPLVVDNPQNVRWSYGGSKILGEIACHAYAQERGMKDFRIVRYHNVYGPRMGFDHVVPQFIERIVKGEQPFTIHGGDETRTFIYVEDAVRATEIVMERPETAGGTYHIGRMTGEIRIKDLAQQLFDIAGVQPPVEILPSPPGSVSRRLPDVTKLAQLGFEPSVGLDDGLARCYDWYKDAFAHKR